MIKKYTYLTLAFMLSFTLVSEETGRHEMHAFYFMQVSNPPAIVGAIDKFASSECGKKFPADMTLMAETINGSSPATHFLILSFETRADFQKAGQLANSCPEAAAMLQSFVASASQVRNSLNLPVAEFGDWTKDSIFLRYDVTLKNETAYIEAWTEMMDSLSTEDSVNGSYGINRAFAGNDQSTHFVYIGASDFDSLTANQQTLTTSSDFAKFSRKVGNNRTVINTSVVIPVKGWPKQ
tara:strand:- start:526 stop:1239 length:714 start_codon:yes stop_codon:yes gene_type:complete